MGRYLNHADQGERLRELLEMAPSWSQRVKTRTKRTFRRLETHRVIALLAAYENGVTPQRSG